MALGIEYITRITIEPLLIKAFREALATSVEIEYIDKSTINILMSEAYRRAKYLKATVGLDG